MYRLVLALAVMMGFSLGASTAMAQAKMSAGILTDQKGMTLYTFDKDATGSGKSACTGPCEKLWPPFMVSGSATAGSSGMASGGSSGSSDYTIIERGDGTKQWAYKGKPLYLWVKDQKPGDKTGDGVANVWHVAKP